MVVVHKGPNSAQNNPGSGDVTKVSARDDQSYADMLKEMKAKVDPCRAGHDNLFIRRTRKEEVLLVLKKGGDVSTIREDLDWRLGRGRKFRPWSRRDPSKLGTTTRPLRNKGLCLPFSLSLAR